MRALPVLCVALFVALASAAGERTHTTSLLRFFDGPWTVRSNEVKRDTFPPQESAIFLNLTTRAGSRYVDGVWRQPGHAPKKNLVQFDNATHGTWLIQSSDEDDELTPLFSFGFTNTSMSRWISQGTYGKNGGFYFMEILPNTWSIIITNDKDVTLQTYAAERIRTADGMEWWMQKLKSNQIFVMVIAVLGASCFFVFSNVILSVVNYFKHRNRMQARPPVRGRARAPQQQGNGGNGGNASAAPQARPSAPIAVSTPSTPTNEVQFAEAKKNE